MHFLRKQGVLIEKLYKIIVLHMSAMQYLQILEFRSWGLFPKLGHVYEVRACLRSLGMFPKLGHVYEVRVCFRS